MLSRGQVAGLRKPEKGLKLQLPSWRGRASVEVAGLRKPEKGLKHRSIRVPADGRVVAGLRKPEKGLKLYRVGQAVVFAIESQDSENPRRD